MKRGFIFYLLWTALLVGLGTLGQIEESKSFFQSYPLWYSPVLAGALCGLLGGILGLYMIWNRIVFASLAITQSAGLGIFLSFFIAGLWGISLEDSRLSPLALLSGCVLAASTAFAFVFFRNSSKRNASKSDEILIGLIYVVSSGMILLIGDRITEGKHAIDNLLFGNAVAVTLSSLILLSGVTSLILFLHFLFRREFIGVTADPDFMQVAGLRTNRWLFLLYLTLTLGITISMKTLGTLPTFALLVIPPHLSLQGAKRPAMSLRLALLIGSLLAPLGYYFSFLYSIPTGASVIVVGMLYLLGGSIRARFCSEEAPGKLASRS